MNEKNDTPTGRITWISGSSALSPSELAASVRLSEKNP